MLCSSSSGRIGSRLESMTASRGLADAMTMLGSRTARTCGAEVACAEVFLLLSCCRGVRPTPSRRHYVCLTAPTPGIGELVKQWVTGLIARTADSSFASKIMRDVFFSRSSHPWLSWRATMSRSRSTSAYGWRLLIGVLARVGTGTCRCLTSVGRASTLDRPTPLAIRVPDRSSFRGWLREAPGSSA